MLDREDDGWTIRSLETGMYAGVENWSTSNGSKVISLEEKYIWHIWREEGSDEHFRQVVLPSPVAEQSFTVFLGSLSRMPE